MDHRKYMSELSGTVHEKRAWALAFFVSLLINAGLTAGILLTKNTIQTTFIPPNLHQAFTLNDEVYSNEYVEQVATWFISQTLIYTPESFKYQMSTFLKHVDPTLFTKLRQTLLQELEDIKKQRRSSTFFTQKVRVKGLSAVVTGVRQIKIGSTDASIGQEHWHVKLTKRADGLVTLADFKEVSEVDAANFISMKR